MKILKWINWFLESLYVEFIEWVKFLLIGTGGLLLIVFMWRIGGLLGKGIVIAIAVFIIGEAIVKTHSKYSEEKNKHQKDKIILEQMKKRIVRIDRLDDNLGEMAARFQKYLDDFKEEGSK